MSAIRKLAAEAADNGLLAPELAAGIARGKSAKSVGGRVGNCIVDLVGKHSRVRTMRMPTWVIVATDEWTAATGVAGDHVFRPVNRTDRSLQ